MNWIDFSNVKIQCFIVNYLLYNENCIFLILLYFGIYYTKQIKNCFSCIFLGIRKLGHYNWWAIVCLMLAMKVRNAHISWALKCFMFLIGILFHWTWLEQIEWEIDRERKKNALMRKHSIKEEWFSVSMRLLAISV